MTQYTIRLFGSIIVSAIALGSFVDNPVLAADTPYIQVGQAKTRKSVIAFPDILEARPGVDRQGLINSITQTITKDLQYMGHYSFLPKNVFREKAKAGPGGKLIKPGLKLGTFSFEDWKGLGADLLIKGSLDFESDQVTADFYVYNIFRGKSVLAKRYVGKARDIQKIGHTFGNDLVQALTGLPGIFLTRIAFSCDRNLKKEIYVMNFDGTSVRQITQHKSIAFAPAWSPAGDRLAYSLFARRKNAVQNIDLYEYDFKTNRIRLLSNRKGINSGAVYSPNGRQIALTMSFLGNPEIFILDSDRRTVTRLTKSFGVDVDPTWNPDGTKLAFSSSRTGKPMIFTMNSNGSNPKRLTFAGRYNLTPSWSQQNNKVAFAGWKQGQFDIFVMNPDGTKIERLTRNEGNNEDPYFSPDGNFITFSSNRSGTKNIYVMSVDGSFSRRLTFGLGNCVAPKWSNPPK